MNEPKKVCNTCGGNGEIGYFQGESRFFITREECPACYGVGYVLDLDEESAADPGQNTQHKEKET
jgi:Archaea-specific RecJ-like exonuclease, contains DnaJ-type Zn finger domain